MAISGTPHQGNRFTGAELIVHLLERQGITPSPAFPAARHCRCMTR